MNTFISRKKFLNLAFFFQFIKGEIEEMFSSL